MVVFEVGEAATLQARCEEERGAAPWSAAARLRSVWLRLGLGGTRASWACGSRERACWGQALDLRGPRLPGWRRCPEVCTCACEA